jgi:hypothetical protein
MVNNNSKRSKKIKLMNFQRWKDDGDWITENYCNLLSEYENNWIAVKNKKIIDYDVNIYKLIGRLFATHASLNNIQKRYIQKY